MKGMCMTSSFALRIKSWPATIVLGASLLLGVSACDKKAEPEKLEYGDGKHSSNTINTECTGRITSEIPPLPVYPQEPFRTARTVGLQEIRTPDWMAGRPDLSKMPNDAVHARTVELLAWEADQ